MRQPTDLQAPRHPTRKKTGGCHARAGWMESEMRHKAIPNPCATAMPTHTSMLHIRADDDLKEQATQALTAMGLSQSFFTPATAPTCLAR
ncbi:type II toxin-antitoxin system RelB/DinJ family antitoxin [Limnohabitans sp.]|uniref:type II toxin-antitoxin system RelB/DinJ family antitoxin n=1 Tax=Limnohabitans sp. TaxID=1907725 RepID=UPI0037BEC06D